MTNEGGSEHEPQLSHGVEQLIADIEGTTGRPVEVRADPGIRSKTRGVYRVTDPDPSRHLILYDPLYEKIKDHLIAHECGHVKLFAEASDSDRIVPNVTENSRRRAIEQLEPEIKLLEQRGLPRSELLKALPFWINGTISQIGSYPADIEIERWLWNAWPGIRKVQESSLREQTRLFRQSLSQEVKAVTPPLIWNVSNSMNGVLVSSYEDLLGDTNLGLAFRRAGFGRDQFELPVFANEDALDLSKANVTSKVWAKKLGISEWFEWKELKRVSSK